MVATERIATEQEFGKVRCPVCGGMIPADEEIAAKPPYNHLLWKSSSKWHIVCPHRYAALRNPNDQIHINVLGIELHVLKSRKYWGTPHCSRCKIRMWKVGTKDFYKSNRLTFKCPECGMTKEIMI